MFPHSNLHSHTNLSDGRNTPREMVEAALKLGFTSYGFSDHGYAPHDDASMSPETEKRYPEILDVLKREYADRIELVTGYEHDLTMPDTDLTSYTYVIESLHFLKVEGAWESVDASAEGLRSIRDRAYGGDGVAMAVGYYRELAARLQRREVLGHIDLITKFNERDPFIDTEAAAYRRAAEDVLALACEKDMLVEINTGAMSRGYRTEPYPSKALLTRLKEMGGRITITSDCHRAEWVDFGFDRAAELARACGFTETWILKNGGFAPVKL